MTLPTQRGEGATIRILDKSQALRTLDELGLDGTGRESFSNSFKKPHGAVLVTGPTGSGKSTTLYAALSELNSVEKNVITIEDPVEYRLEGINQINVEPQGRPDLRRRPALDPPRRPRHHHGRRDPRRRDRANRHRGGAHRPHGALDAAHEQRAGRHRPALEDGHRKLPGRVLDRVRRRPAPGPQALPALQEAHGPGPAVARRGRLRGQPRTSRPSSPTAAPAATAPATAGASACSPS